MLLLLVGCGGAAVTPTRTVEPAATTTARPVPTISPPPSPTAAAEGIGWQEFLHQKAMIGDEYRTLYGAMLDATEGPIGSITTRLGLASLEMMVWAEEHRSTLLANPPDDPCYEDAWRVAVKFTDHAYDFADFSGDLALDPSDMMASSFALAAMEDATTALTDVGDEIGRADC